MMMGVGFETFGHYNKLSHPETQKESINPSSPKRLGILTRNARAAKIALDEWITSNAEASLELHVAGHLLQLALGLQLGLVEQLDLLHDGIQGQLLVVGHTDAHLVDGRRGQVGLRDGRRLHVCGCLGIHRVGSGLVG
eukprot:scaffold577744_cov46-Prasinocladus_malaysianus.AAC.1